MTMHRTRKHSMPVVGCCCKQSHTYYEYNDVITSWISLLRPTYALMHSQPILHLFSTNFFSTLLINFFFLISFLLPIFTIHFLTNFSTISTSSFLLRTKNSAAIRLSSISCLVMFNICLHQN